MSHSLAKAIQESWSKISPLWPLKNVIAVNPLQGFEDLPIEMALQQGSTYFQNNTLPEPLHEVNRQTIKWLQAFYDDGQAAISMPLRHQGLYAAWRQMAPFDDQIHQGIKSRKICLKTMPTSPEDLIDWGLSHLNIQPEDQGQFLTLLLTTLPGWASIIKYHGEWSTDPSPFPHHKSDYLAMRMALLCLLWPRGKELLVWHKGIKTQPLSLSSLLPKEAHYQRHLLRHMGSQKQAPAKNPEAQIVFCIDVRSEPFRRSIEEMGNYETIGFAGFFGLPIRIKNQVSGVSHAACPVLLTPSHLVSEYPHGTPDLCKKNREGFRQLALLRRLYQSLKYTFTTPFSLVEALGPLAGVWMALKTFFPRLSHVLKKSFLETIRPPLPHEADLQNISLEEQCLYGESALRMMGIAHTLAPVVIFCGHGSASENNAYATALDCGACGGHKGGSNAAILAQILNSPEVRERLKNKGLVIPATTRFLGAQHNTTTDEITLLQDPSAPPEDLAPILHDFEGAAALAQRKQGARMGQKNLKLLSQDWAQVRPEWGLARNASFIVGPRWLTQHTDLEGRAFLHTYQPQEDQDGLFLTTILTAPMVVAQWINAQYFFSSLDPVAYGSGSKLTQNITGKMGVMQGNASDLMQGLPIQSLYKMDGELYHEPLRLSTFIYAPRERIDRVIQQNPILQKLFGHGWVYCLCVDPEETGQAFRLRRDLAWEKIA